MTNQLITDRVSPTPDSIPRAPACSTQSRMGWSRTHAHDRAERLCAHQSSQCGTIEPSTLRVPRTYVIQLFPMVDQLFYYIVSHFAVMNSAILLH
jgi:hypothetical protein